MRPLFSLTLSFALMGIFSAHALSPGLMPGQNEPGHLNHGLADDFGPFQYPLAANIRRELASWEVKNIADKDTEYLAKVTAMALEQSQKKPFLWKSQNEHYLISGYSPDDDFGKFMELPETNSIGLIYWRADTQMHLIKIGHVANIKDPFLFGNILRGFDPTKLLMEVTRVE
ncbi:hypothetical protein BCV70DRAFT_217840 [Testicularia cyperi]|uniref:Uncharacterized protein n=1 Tax=Testicularia cyperi TaxID=1882483 RepID=A0A317XNP7_9BASI|nr:hypothetical protein BCV70DRAFT_217840 [Testicularia cyperi]